MSMLRIASSCMIIVTVLDMPSAYGSFHEGSTAEKEEPQAPTRREGGRRPGEVREKSRPAWPSRPSAAHCPGWRTCSNIPHHTGDQILVAMTLAWMSEALVYEARVGIDPALLVEAMRSSGVWRAAIIKIWRKCNNGLLLPIERRTTS